MNLLSRTLQDEPGNEKLIRGLLRDDSDGLTHEVKRKCD